MSESSSEVEKDIKVLLEENHRLLLENNMLLKRMRRNALIATLLRLVWFAIILVASWYAYAMYVAPNLAFMKEQTTLFGELVPENGQLKSWYDQLRSNNGTIE